MTNTERIIAYLRSIAPNSASNTDICSGTRISPHAQVFQITRAQMNAGVITGRQFGKEWQFSFNDNNNRSLPRPHQSYDLASADNIPTHSPANAAEFEQLARVAMSQYYNMPLGPARMPDVPKTFDLVSVDQMIVGDAKFYTLVNGTGTPPAKFSVIAEYVWLLERTHSRSRFLVFGNDIRVPERWLQIHRKLRPGCDFYFLSSDGNIQVLYQHSSALSLG